MCQKEAHPRLGGSLPGRIVILRALQLGDLLCAVPAFRALRGAFPDAEIVLIGLPWARAFVDRYPDYLDGFREFPGFPGLPERTPQLERFPGFLAEIQAERFDLAVQLHGSGPIVNPLTVALGARHSAGFYLPGDHCPDPLRFMPWPDRGLEIRRMLGLMEFLGVPPLGEHLEFPLYEEDHRALHAVEEVRPLRPGQYACVHPGASVPERRWAPGRFARVAEALVARGLCVVLTGTAAESELTRAVARESEVPLLDLAGRTGLGALAALLQGACLLVSNDTGVSHVAAALRVPSVIISTGDNPGRWAPIDVRRHRVLCSDAGVSPAEVIAQVDDLRSDESIGADALAVMGGAKGTRREHEAGAAFRA
jgi:ADP-heptose:LPS heptosyltransferase